MQILTEWGKLKDIGMRSPFHSKAFSGALVATLALAAGMAFLSACDLGSADGVAGVVSDNDGAIYDFSGLYLRADSEENPLPLVSPAGRQTGIALTWLRLAQHGSLLEAYDNAGMPWAGSISSVRDGVASFTLRGRTSAGAGVETVGTLSYANPNSTLDAAWIEPSFSGSLFATASVSPPSTNTPSGSLRISPTSASLGPGNTSRTFTASGGTGSYSWSVANSSLGTVNPASGSTITYTSRSVAGQNTITVRDSAGNAATATATYSSSAEPGDLTITPQIIKFESAGGVSAPFTASGGTPPYYWTLSSTTLGSLSALTGTTVTYTRTDLRGTNIVTLIDNTGAAVTGRAEY